MTAARPALALDIVSDVMCPWCFIGKRHLEAALGGANLDVRLRWRPYRLDPTLPPEGRDRREYLEAKFGGPERARAIYARVEEAGAGVGISFRFDRIAVSPNTLDAHRLIRWAGEAGSEAQESVVEALFTAYFIEGRNIGDPAVLVAIAASAGLDGDAVARDLASDRDRQAIAAEASRWTERGVSGVPTFIVDGRYAIVGAQPPTVLRDALAEIAAARSAA